MHNPISNLIHSACSESVNTVIIDGRVIMQDREIGTVNEYEILTKAQKLLKGLG